MGLKTGVGGQRWRWSFAASWSASLVSSRRGVTESRRCAETRHDRQSGPYDDGRSGDYGVFRHWSSRHTCGSDYRTKQATDTLASHGNSGRGSRVPAGTSSKSRCRRRGLADVRPALAVEKGRLVTSVQALTGMASTATLVGSSAIVGVGAVVVEAGRIQSRASAVHVSGWLKRLAQVGSSERLCPREVKIPAATEQFPPGLFATMVFFSSALPELL